MSDITAASSLSLAQRAFLAVKDLRAKLDTVERAKKEPIAIVGIGCRFPGGANDQVSYWRMLCEGYDAVTDIPAERWDVEAFYDPDPDAPGKMYTRRGAFLSQVDGFDAHFFGIAPREAVQMDPQQRLVLELSWEALEDAGIRADSLRGSSTGVFVGIMNSDYAQVQGIGRTTENIDAYVGTGYLFSAAAGRIAYTLGFQGPALSVDTACSSSLVTVHLACQSLRAGECDLALAGGVNLLLRPEPFITSAKIKALAPDGQCKTFDATANGYVRGEGGGMVVLKRLSDALRDHDPIMATIRGSAVTHNGPSSGLTVPNGQSQQIAIRNALANAGLAPTDVSYVEAHGTGTPLGDPIEMQALSAVLCKGRNVENPLAVGSVKTNIGHLESAAGIAGLIKLVLMLKHRAIPPHLHLHKVNPLISLSDLNITVPTEYRGWSTAQKSLIGGASSFGISGTNAHVILEQAPEASAMMQHTQTASESNAPASYLLPLSAFHPQALEQLSQAYREQLSTQPVLSLQDVCYSASLRRSHHEQRMAVVGSSTEELATQLAQFQLDPTYRELNRQREEGMLPRIVFVYPGQGTQWAGMGRRLAAQEPVFQQKLEECDTYLRELATWSLFDELYAEKSRSRLHETEVTQPTLFAIQVALTALWHSWGIVPHAVIGHSFGEIAAAHSAAILSLQDAMRIAYYRGLYTQKAHGRGKMATVGMSQQAVQEILRGREEQLSIAAVNSPDGIVLTGEPQAMYEVLEELQSRNVFCRLLEVQYASHSPQMTPFQEPLAQALQDIVVRTAEIPIYSTVTGQLSRAHDFSPAYWKRNIREPVLFTQAFGAALQEDYRIFVEISSHQALTTAMMQCLEANGQAGAVLTSLQRDQDERRCLLQSLSTLYTLGARIDWTRLYPEGGNHVHLPAYPWQRTRYWASPDSTTIASDVVQKLSSFASSLLDTHETEQQVPYEWLYKVQWEPQALSALSPEMVPGQVWLILSDQQGIGTKLAQFLSARGIDFLLVRPGDSYQQLDAKHYCLQPNNLADWKRFFATIPTAGTTYTGILHLWSLDTLMGKDEVNNVDLEAAQALSSESTLTLVQAMLHGTWQQARPRLWVVTRGVQSIGQPAGVSALVQAAAWGLGRAITLEHPEVWGGMIDLDPASSLEEDATALLAEINRQDQNEEDQVAFRLQQRYVPRLVQWAPQHNLSAHYKLRPDGVYLLTGGLGSVGRKIARWMVEQGARHLLIAGRRALPERELWATLTSENPLYASIAVIQEIEKLGATVHYKQADAGDAERAAEIFTAIDQLALPLYGIVHAAGVFNSDAIEHLELATFRENMRAKAWGAFTLMQLSARRQLDFLLLLSSATSVLGLKDMAPYAASNYFLDILAHYGQSTYHLPVISINWGLWDQAEDISARTGQLFAQVGMSPMSLPRIFTMLSALLSLRLPQVMVARIDWNTFKPIYEARRPRPLLQRIAMTSDTPLSNSQDEVEQPALLQRLEAEHVEQRKKILQVYLQEEISAILGLSSEQLLETNQGFFRAGMNSLMVVELRNRLQVQLGQVLPASMVFNYSTIEALTNHLLHDVLALQSSPCEVVAPLVSPREPQSELLEEIEELTDEEALLQLSEELGRNRR